MTIDEIRALSDDSLRVGIARALGWAAKGYTFGSENLIPMQSVVCQRLIPNWPNDLNACAELRRDIEKRRLVTRYCMCLVLITGADVGMRTWCLAGATARQHSEAALMALQGGDDAPKS